MSSPLSKDAITYRQRILSCSGFYTGAIDGEWGPKTEKSDNDFHAEYLRLQTIGGSFDPRTESNIITLLPKAQEKARAFMRIAGAVCKIISGTRTYPEQHALYLQRPRVTKADSGFSNHNFGIAWDVGIWNGGHYLTGATPAEEGAYKQLAAKVKAHLDGIEWGGDWHSIVDNPHFNLITGKTTAQIRASFEAGRPFT